MTFFETGSVDMAKEIIILGGGVIGLAAAFECRKRGHHVTVLDIAACGGQASGAAAGMLAPYSEISEDPDDFFLLCAESLKEYPEWQKDVKQASGLDFEYRKTGSLSVVFHEAELLPLETRKTWQKEFGVEATIIRREQLKDLEPNLTDDIVAALYTPDESHLYSPDYVRALKQACLSIGVTIYEHLQETEIVEWKTDITVRSKDGRQFSADTLVISNGAWSLHLGDVFGLTIPVFPIRGQICSYKCEGAVNHLIFSSQGYLVSKENGTLVCGATEDVAGFNTEVTDKGIARLEKWSKTLLPCLQEVPVDHRWAGLRPATQDGFPLIGPLSNYQHVLFATGHYRNGILLSPITAKIVADQVDGLPERLSLAAFSPERFS